MFCAMISLAWVVWESMSVVIQIALCPARLPRNSTMASSPGSPCGNSARTLLTLAFNAAASAGAK